jgi:hypothetical protein
MSGSNVKIAIVLATAAILISDTPANYRVLLATSAGTSLEPIAVPLVEPCVANFDNVPDGDYLGIVQCVRADGSLIDSNQINFQFTVAPVVPATVNAQVPSSVSVTVTPNAR